MANNLQKQNQKNYYPQSISIAILTLSLMLISGCSPLIVKYDSIVGDPFAIPYKANILVQIDENNLSRYFPDQRTKQSIIDAIKSDLEKNLFHFSSGQESFSVLVKVNKLDFTNEPWGLLWFPLIYMGLPLARMQGDAEVSLEIRGIDGQSIGNYYAKKSESAWQGLYYNWGASYQYNGGVAKDALRFALEDIKNQVLFEKQKIITAIRNSQRETISQQSAIIPETKPKTLISQQMLSDVDINIPVGKTKNPDAIAIIFGIEQYRNAPQLTYGRRDAEIFKEYAVNVFGIPNNKNNIYLRVDEEATRAEFEKVFSQDGWLARRVKPTSDVYVYIACHGTPDIKTQTPYLVPYDGDPNYAKETCFNLNKIYEELSKLNTQSITVFLDACFTGISRDKLMLLSHARPVTIVIDNPILLSDKLIVFFASQNDQISSGYPEKQHGLFTYFILKGLRGDADKDFDKRITVKELEDYVIEHVENTAGLLDREQKPEVIGKNKRKILVEY